MSKYRQEATLGKSIWVCGSRDMVYLWLGRHSAGVRLMVTLCPQEAESRECSAHFLLFIQFRTPAYGMVPPTVGRCAHFK